MAKVKLNLMPLLMAFHNAKKNEPKKVEKFEAKKGLDNSKEEKMENMKMKKGAK
jgi:hypothetical protein